MDKFSKPLADIYDIKKELYESGKPIGNHVSDYEGHYQERVDRIYAPKVQFLLESIGGKPTTLLDVGCGDGCFVAASRSLGFDARGLDPNDVLVAKGRRVFDLHHRLFCIKEPEVPQFIADFPVEIVSFIGVLEHIDDPTPIFNAINSNPHINYIFFSLPLLSASFFFESFFPNVASRHSAHAIFFSDPEIDSLCSSFHWSRLANWYFGLDFYDLFRSALIDLSVSDKYHLFPHPCSEIWRSRFFPLIDSLQSVLDHAKFCSEVLVLARKSLAPSSLFS